MIELKKFNCGCIGFDPLVIVKACDSGSYESDRSLMVSATNETRIREPERYTLLSHDESKEILEALNRLVIDGYKFREVRSILGVEVK